MMQSCWERLLSYHSTETVQKKLEECYKGLSMENTHQTSYDNCYRFIYFLKHGENFFKQADQSPYAIQPMLLFYGLSQLLKACLLTVDPGYPETSSVLAHGVSSRKRKKQQYLFLQDEVKIQRNGLFPHIANKLFHIHHLDGEKYSMKDLFNQIPEMDDVFSFHTSKKHYIKINQINNQFMITEEISIPFHLSANRFAELISQLFSYEISTIKNHDVFIKKKGKLAIYDCHPFLYHLEEDCFYLPATRDTFSVLPELLSHYILLYNLSMISRYETEWWYDLLLSAPNDDYPFILRYMEIAKRKIPFFIFNFLEGRL